MCHTIHIKTAYQLNKESTIVKTMILKLQIVSNFYFITSDQKTKVYGLIHLTQDRSTFN